MREFQKKYKKTLIWAFWVKMEQIGSKRGHFRIFGEKVKTVPSFPIFLFFKIKSKKIPMRSFGENLADGERHTEKQSVTIGQNPPGGCRTKKLSKKVSFLAKNGPKLAFWSKI